MGFLSQFQKNRTESTASALSRHERLIFEFLERVDTVPEQDCNGRRMTIIARSPASPVIQAFVKRARDLKVRSVVTQIILAKLDPESDLHDMLSALSTLAGGDDVGGLVRWASNSCILDAHEQLILGTDMCWSGDSMRREPGKRDGLDLFERDAPKTVRLGVLAFDAIWTASVPVPASRLAARPASKPVAAYMARAGNALPNPTALLRGGRPVATRH